VKLRGFSSLQKIRKALNELRFGLGETEHLSRYTLVADRSSIYLLEPDKITDLVASRGNLVIHELGEVLDAYYYAGRNVPALFRPRSHLSVQPEVRGGEPVIKGTRIPALEVASPVRDGLAPAQIGDFYPSVTADAASDAEDFAAYVDSYQAQASEAA
jgi:uncharacterized protein (DUF433 family)